MTYLIVVVLNHLLDKQVAGLQAQYEQLQSVSFFMHVWGKREHVILVNTCPKDS